MSAELLSEAEVQRRLRGLQGWSLAGGRLVKDYAFPNFSKALGFVNRVGALADQKGHHPDVLLGWGRVRLEFTTHDAGGLTSLDFELAAESDRVL